MRVIQTFIPTASGTGGNGGGLLLLFIIIAVAAAIIFFTSNDAIKENATKKLKELI